MFVLCCLYADIVEHSHHSTKRERKFPVYWEVLKQKCQTTRALARHTTPSSQPPSRIRKGNLFSSRSLVSVFMFTYFLCSYIAVAKKIYAVGNFQEQNSRHQRKSTLQRDNSHAQAINLFRTATI